MADLNQTTMAEIKRALAENGVEGVAAPKLRGRRKNPATIPPPEVEAPPAPLPELPQGAVPDIYRKIENILATLPEDMGVKARWGAGKMLAEVFAEYLMVRLRLEEGDQNETR